MSGYSRVIRNLLMATSLVLLAAVSVCAQEGEHGQLPDAPSVASPPSPTATQQDAVVFHKKVFWTLVAVDAASAVADAQISRAGLEMCPNYGEINAWLYGRRPSLGKYYAMDAIVDGGAAFLGYKLLRSRRRFVRMSGWLPLAVTSASHTDGAIRWARVIGSNCNPSP